MTIESKHGMDEPHDEPPQARGARLAETGAKMQNVGQQMESCGGSIIKIGCSGFVLLVIVFIVIALLSSSGHSVPLTAGNAETQAATSPEPSRPLAIGSSATLKGQQSGESLEATVVAYKAYVRGGEYNEPSAGMKYVGITLRLKNTGAALYSDSPSNGAVILTASGQHGKTAVIVQGECSEGFAEGVRITPGESQEGCIAFELPIGTGAAKFQWTPSSGYGEETAEWGISSTHAATPASAAVPPNPSRTATSTFFRSPSGNIECEMHTREENQESPSAYCQTTHPPRTVAMATNGALERGSEIGTTPHREAVLPYGNAETLGPWTCLSLTTGMRCTVASGQGFEISSSGVTELHS